MTIVRCALVPLAAEGLLLQRARDEGRERIPLLLCIRTPETVNVLLGERGRLGFRLGLRGDREFLAVLLLHPGPNVSPLGVIRSAVERPNIRAA